MIIAILTRTQHDMHRRNIQRRLCLKKIHRRLFNV